jgi:hypothetical protein
LISEASGGLLPVGSRAGSRRRTAAQHSPPRGVLRPHGTLLVDEHRFFLIANAGVRSSGRQIDAAIQWLLCCLSFIVVLRERALKPDRRGPPHVALLRTFGHRHHISGNLCSAEAHAVYPRHAADVSKASLPLQRAKGALFATPSVRRGCKATVASFICMSDLSA